MDNTAKLNEDTIREAMGAAEDVRPKPEAGTAEWPEPLDRAAFHGVAGEMVDLVAPHTESDPAALLIQLLVGAGNLFGRHLFFKVESTDHHLNLFVVLVGPSAKGRKGTAWEWVKRVLVEIDPSWGKRLQTGLSSGEGLIYSVRDAVTGSGNGRRKGKSDNGPAITDAGVIDKRALFMQPEFSAVLKVCAREGNTLSDVIRAAWDGGDLQVATKNFPNTATSPHISIIGHISREELNATFKSTDAANGFGNRFDWVCAKRSNILPLGGNLRSDALNPIIAKMRRAHDFARQNPGEMRFTPEAEAHWRKIYADLSGDRTGLVGALLGRAEAQVRRLACIYAALDATQETRTEHLLAALAVWEYAERSVAFIFRDNTGNPDADRILAALLKDENGLTRTMISELFGGHLSAERIDQALGALNALGLASKHEIKTGGRPEQRWHAKPSKPRR
jgi:hypothetical protein